MEEKRNDSQVPDKHIEKANIVGKVTKKKRSRFAELFIKEDLNNVRTYIVQDVIIPSVVDLFRNAVNNAIDITFYGETRKDRRSSGSRMSRISYNRCYDDDRRYYKRDRDEDRERRHYDYEDIEFRNRGDALDVIRSLNEIINEYGILSINDYYETLPQELLEELDIHPVFTDEKYGWTDLRGIHEERCFGGKWRIVLPRAVPLN